MQPRRGLLEYKNNKFKSSTMRIYIFYTYSCEASRLFITPNQVAELGKKRARKESQRERVGGVCWKSFFFLSERTEVENISLLLLLHLVHTEGAIRGAWWWWDATPQSKAQQSASNYHSRREHTQRKLLIKEEKESAQELGSSFTFYCTEWEFLSAAAA